MITFEFIHILLVTLVVSAVPTYWYVRTSFLYWKKRGVPYLRPSFPFGDFKDLFLQRLSFSDTVTMLYNSSSEAILGVYITTHPSLIVRDPKLLRDILIKDFQHFSYRGANIMEKVDPMTNNLMMQYGEKWKENRSKMSTPFTTAKLKEMFDTILRCCKINFPSSFFSV